MLEKTLESSLDSEEIQAVHPKGNQYWIYIGRTDAEAEALILWPPDVKSWLTGKDLDTGKDWGQEEKGMTEDEMVGWHHWLNGHEFDQTPGDREGQGGLACCSPWGCKELNTTEWLNKELYGGFPGGSDGEEFAMQETWISSLGQEDPLEKRMATHFSILAWRVPWTEESGEL